MKKEVHNHDEGEGEEWDRIESFHSQYYCKELHPDYWEYKESINYYQRKNKQIPFGLGWEKSLPSEEDSHEYYQAARRHQMKSLNVNSLDNFEMYMSGKNLLWLKYWVPFEFQ